MNDAGGGFEWAAPDPEEHAFVNDLERAIGTYLYGRRMYEVMRVWETWETSPSEPVTNDYAAVWRAADKIVYSTSLDAVSTPRTRLERTFDPEALRALVATTDRDVSIGGPTVAAHAFAAGLVDEIHLFVHPVIVGGGARAMPDGVQVDLELLDEHRFASGVVHLHHRVRH